jgi:preprotein translocase subunit SecG
MGILITIQIIVTLAMIGVILLQRSEGGGLGMGSSNSMFTARGTANLLTRTTGVLAALFIGLCILMTAITNANIKKASQFLDETTQTTPKA